MGARKAAYHEPRFIGGDGIMSYFHGRKDKEFHLVSDMSISMLILLARETRREEKNVPTCLLFSSSKIYDACCLCVFSTVELGAVHALLVILFINTESGVIIVPSSMQQLQLQLVVYMKLQISLSIKEFFTHDSSVSNVTPVISTRT